MSREQIVGTRTASFALAIILLAGCAGKGRCHTGHINDQAKRGGGRRSVWEEYGRAPGGCREL